MKRLKAILFCLCPSCMRGKVFKGYYRVTLHCNECGYDYGPGGSYFIGRMYVSTPLSILFAVPSGFILYGMGVSQVWFWGLLIAQIKITDLLLFHQAQTALIHAEYLLRNY